MQAYPGDALEAALRNVFDFDVYKPETIAKLGAILDHHGYGSVPVNVHRTLNARLDI